MDYWKVMGTVSIYLLDPNPAMENYLYRVSCSYKDFNETKRAIVKYIVSNLYSVAIKVCSRSYNCVTDFSLNIIFYIYY